MKVCETCGHDIAEVMHGFYPAHECPPLWTVWCDRGHDGRDYRAQVRCVTSRDAAEIWAQRIGALGKVITDGGMICAHVVQVGSAKGTAPIRFAVHGEMVPEYNARYLGQGDHSGQEG